MAGCQLPENRFINEGNGRLSITQSMSCQLGLKSQIFFINPGCDIWETVRLTMSAVPEFQPTTVSASIIFVFNAEALCTPSKLFLWPLHHGFVVLWLLVVQEGDCRERGRKRFSNNALWRMITNIRALCVGGQKEKISGKLGVYCWW